MKNEIFDVEMLRRRFIRPYFIELGLTVGQGQPRILKELRKHGAMNQKELSDACLIEVTTIFPGRTQPLGVPSVGGIRRARIHAFGDHLT